MKNYEVEYFDRNGNRLVIIAESADSEEDAIANAIRSYGDPFDGGTVSAKQVDLLTATEMDAGAMQRAEDERRVMLEVGKAAMREKALNGWVSAKTNPPNVEGRYLTYTPDVFKKEAMNRYNEGFDTGELAIMKYSSRTWHKQDGYFTAHPLYWMRLPALPDLDTIARIDVPITE